MRRSLGILLLVAGLAGLGLWAWRYFFPNPEQVIRSGLRRMAQLASFRANEGPLAKLGNAPELASLFTGTVEVKVDLPGHGPMRVAGRDELMKSLLAIRQRVSALRVDFLDVNVQFEAGGDTAIANLTLKAAVPGERDFAVEEFNFHLRRSGRRWLVELVETVKTLSERSRERGDRLTAGFAA